MSAYPAQTTWRPQPSGPAIQAQDGSVAVVSNPLGFTPTSNGLAGSLVSTYGARMAWEVNRLGSHRFAPSAARFQPRQLLAARYSSSDLAARLAGRMGP